MDASNLTDPAALREHGEDVVRTGVVHPGDVGRLFNALAAHLEAEHGGEGDDPRSVAELRHEANTLPKVSRDYAKCSAELGTLRRQLEREHTLVVDRNKELRKQDEQIRTTEANLARQEQLWREMRDDRDRLRAELREALVGKGSSITGQEADALRDALSAMEKERDEATNAFADMLRERDEARELWHTDLCAANDRAEKAEAGQEAIRKELNNWKGSAEHACEGIVCTPGAFGSRGLLMELRDLCEARGRKLAATQAKLEEATKLAHEVAQEGHTMGRLYARPLYESCGEKPSPAEEFMRVGAMVDRRLASLAPEEGADDWSHQVLDDEPTTTAEEYRRRDREHDAATRLGVLDKSGPEEKRSEHCSACHVRILPGEHHDCMDSPAEEPAQQQEGGGETTKMRNRVLSRDPLVWVEEPAPPPADEPLFTPAHLEKVREAIVARLPEFPIYCGFTDAVCQALAGQEEESNG